MSQINIKFDESYQNVYQDLVNLLESQDSKINILQINNTRFDFYDLTLLNEFEGLPTIHELQIIHISSAKMLYPAISQISPLYNIQRLDISLQLTEAMLNAILSPSITALGLHGTLISHKMMKLLYKLQIKELDFSGSQIESLAGLLKAVPLCRAIVLEDASVMDIILLTAQFDSIHVYNTKSNGFEQCQLSQILPSMDKGLNDIVHDSGLAAVQDSQLLCQKYDQGFADFALRDNQFDGYLDCYTINLVDSQVNFWMRQQEGVYANWESIKLRGKCRPIKSLIALPSQDEKNYLRVLQGLSQCIDFTTLDFVGLGIQGDDARQWLEEYTKTNQNLILRERDQQKVFRGKCRVMVLDDFRKPRIKPYVIKRRDALM